MVSRLAHAKQRGFTLIELSLAITFISVLLLSILYVTIQAGKLYAKGVTYKDINQVSREVVDTMRRDMMATSASAIEIPTPMPDPSLSPAYAGRLCTGQISYVWNTAALLQDAASTDRIMDGAIPVVFRRVVDPGKTLCTKDATGKYVKDIAGMTSTELLKGEGRELAAYTFSVTEMARSSERKGLYRVSMTLGTNETDTTLYDTVLGSYTCRPPTDNTANFEYCTVIEFDAIMRAGGNV